MRNFEVLFKNFVILREHTFFCIFGDCCYDDDDDDEEEEEEE